MKYNKIFTLLILITFLPVGTFNADAYHPGPGICSSVLAHDAITLEGLEMVKSDRYEYVYQEVSRNIQSVCLGSTSADLETVNGNHFLHPDSHTWKGETWVQDNFNLAVANHASNPTLAYYYFGRALHVVQDLTSPHHSHGAGIDDLIDENGHLAYELAADALFLFIASINNAYNGIYSFSGSASSVSYQDSLSHWSSSDSKGWVDYAAHRSYDYYSYVDGPINDPGNNYGYALGNLLPYAVQLTAGFMKLFVDRITPHYYMNGYVNFNYITVKDQEIGREEFQLQLQCKNSAGSWRTIQNTYAFDISAPSSPKTYYANDQDYFGQKLSSASYEPFSYCYDKSGSDIRVRLIEDDLASYSIIVDWYYFEMSGISNSDYFRSKTSSGQGFEVKFHFY